MRTPVLVMSILALTIGSTSIGGEKGEKEAKADTITSAAEKVDKECSADIKRHCSEISPGGGRIAACLKSKDDVVSTSCNAARVNLESVLSEKVDQLKVSFRKSCGDDIQKHCEDVPSGKGRLLECLEDHEDELSKSCKNFQARLEEKLDEALS